MKEIAALKSMIKLAEEIKHSWSETFKKIEASQAEKGKKAA